MTAFPEMYSQNKNFPHSPYTHFSRCLPVMCQAQHKTVGVFQAVFCSYNLILRKYAFEMSEQ